MSINQDDEIDDSDRGHSAAVDPFLVALQLCSIATNAKAIEPALKRLRKLGRDIEKAQQKLAAVQDRAAQTNAALDARAAALDDERARSMRASPRLRVSCKRRTIVLPRITTISRTWIGASVTASWPPLACWPASMSSFKTCHLGINSDAWSPDCRPIHRRSSVTSLTRALMRCQTRSPIRTLTGMAVNSLAR
jgi:hypothetical protein